MLSSYLTHNVNELYTLDGNVFKCTPHDGCHKWYSLYPDNFK